MRDDVLMRPAIFLDKDGTLIDDVPYNVDPARIRLSDRAGEGLRLLARLGRPLIVVTNQSGVARGLFAEEALEPVRHRLRVLMEDHGAPLGGFYHCPHHPDASVPRFAVACTCRKPMPGMLLQAARDHGIDLARSWMIGDILNDVEAGRRAGCRTVLINNGNETEWLRSPEREPDFIAADLWQAASWIVAQTERRQPAAGRRGA